MTNISDALVNEVVLLLVDLELVPDDTKCPFGHDLLEHGIHVYRGDLERYGAQCGHWDREDGGCHTLLSRRVLLVARAKGAEVTT